MDDRRLEDLVRYGTSADVAGALSAIRDTFIRVAEWVRKNKPRDRRNLALFNLLTAVVPYVALAEHHRDGPAQVLALCARCLYELRLRLRHILRSPEALDRWLSELAADRIEILEGCIALWLLRSSNNWLGVLSAHIALVLSATRQMLTTSIPSLEVDGR